MLDNLKDGLRSAIKKIVSSSGIDEELIKELAKDVQRSLLQSDVNVKLVLEITKNLQERCINETPPPGLSRKDHIVKILYDELSKLLGKDTEFHFKSGKINKVLMLGIQGSGKTTVSSKLAKFLTKQGYRVGAIGADTYRPGALIQLRTNCEKSNVEVYGEENNKDSPNIVKNGLIPTQVRANSGAGLYAPTEKQLKSSLDFFQKRMENPDYQLDYPKYDVSEQDIDRVQEVMINEMGKKEYSRVMGLIQKAGGVDPKLTTGEAGKQRARDIIRLYLSHGGRSAVTGEVVPFNQMQLDHRIAYSNAIKNVAEKKKKGIKTTLLEEQDRLDSPENWDLMESSINQMKNSLEPSALVNRINQKLSQSPEEKELKKLEQEVKNLREAKLLQNLVSSFSKGDYGGMNQQNIENMSADEIDVVMKAWNYWHPNTRDAIIFRRIDPNYDKKLKAKGIQIPPPDHSNTIVRGQAQKGSHRSRGEKRPVADRKRVTIEAMKKEKVLQSKKVTNITDMVLLKAIKDVDKSLKTQTSRIGTLKQAVKQQKSKKK